MTFESFFRAATGFSPWPYQHKLATERDWPRVLHVPTGAGKTAAVVLAWIWRRRFHPDAEVQRATPRRLVYALPMRVLVRQTYDRALSYVRRLGLGEDQADRPVRVGLLMGGNQDREWWLYPEDDVILIGTSDMLLSRALNRGYAESRFHWPIDFGLLNNDALWVLDEIQLLSEGLATSRQLDGLRAALGSWAPVPTLWMSATYHPGWMETVDGLPISPDQVWTLTPADLEAAPDLARRMNAPKRLQRASLTVPDGEAKAERYVRQLTALVRERHAPRSLTLVVLNTVQRAQRLFELLRETPPRAKDRTFEPAPEIVLLHSQFRAADRNNLNQLLFDNGNDAPGGRIIVATQVVEAGVDISARTMITELAPWPSLVQRFGRVNRYGEHDESDVLWIDVDAKAGAPYEPEALDEARRLLESLGQESVSPARLQEVDYEGGPAYRYILRRKDLVDLFDTTPDLSGNDIDVSRFIRADADLDAHVFWRAWEGEASGQEPPVEWPPVQQAELCPVPVYGRARGLQEFLRRVRERGWAWRWDHMEARWVRITQVETIRPGQVVLLPARLGGYDPYLGWTANPAHGPVDPVVDGSDGDAVGQREAESAAGDPLSIAHPWITLREHTEDVVDELESILSALPPECLPERTRAALRKAARFHDWGKAHPRFQARFLEAAEGDEREMRSRELWAKAPRARLRPLIRHEVASGLAFLTHMAAGREDDLPAFLIMAHHGKVRVGLRGIWRTQEARDDEGALLGIRNGDQLPGTNHAVDLGGGVRVPPVTLDLSLFALGSSDGRPSWLARVLALRDDPNLGPFRLAYLEALLRVADARASMKEVTRHAGR